MFIKNYQPRNNHQNKQSNKTIKLSNIMKFNENHLKNFSKVKPLRDSQTQEIYL